MQFEFATANRIIFGPGRLQEVPPLARSIGERVLLVHGLTNLRLTRFVEELIEQGCMVETYLVDSEPTVDMIEIGLNLARGHDCDLVIGFGGGSAMDTAKAIAILVTNPGSLFDYLEVIGRGKLFSNPGVACIAIPTTSGTGAEVTRNAVVGSPRDRVKVSLRSPWMLPTLAVIDPELTYDLSPDLTASTGLDALTQLIEPYVSNQSNVMTDLYCREGIQRVARSLEQAYHFGQDQAARQDMSLASLLGGLALANSRLGAVHGFAGVLGGMFYGAHGAICARLLPLVMEVNLRALRQRQPKNMVLGRFADLAVWLTQQPDASTDLGMETLQGLAETLKVPRLSQYGLSVEDIPWVTQKAAQASSMKGNPIQLTQDEMVEILQRAL